MQPAQIITESKTRCRTNSRMKYELRARNAFEKNLRTIIPFRCFADDVTNHIFALWSSSTVNKRIIVDF